MMNISGQRIVMFFVVVIGVSTVCTLGFSQTSPGKTVLDGVFTSAQADKGEKEYEARCTRCHEGNDPEGPTLMGRTFIDRWREDNLEELFDYMKDKMPADAAGSLS